jgi:hypothetical protein
LDIEDPHQLDHYLRARGSLQPGEVMQTAVLSGGVSNKAVLVFWPDGRSWVVKQALPKLRVQADWFSDPARIHREALGLRWYTQVAPPGAVPELLFEDEVEHVLAMQAVPQPHENWKAMLLRGALDFDHVRQFAALLGCCHRRATGCGAEIRPLFADRRYFEALRLEPYYRYAAARVPEATDFLDALIDETLATAVTLVHGDYSPKNVLVRDGRLVLLDYEVAHWGDPSFDAGFALTHLLSKAHHLVAQRPRFAEAANLFWQTYAGEVRDRFSGIEARAVRQTLGCLLARVDGRSPLEYLSGAERDRQRRAALALMHRPPYTIDELVVRFLELIGLA